MLAPVTMATRSKAWTVLARSNTEVEDSNPTRGMGICMRLFCVYVVLCIDSRLAIGRSSVQGVLPIVYTIKNLKISQDQTKRSRGTDTEMLAGRITQITKHLLHFYSACCYFISPVQNVVINNDICLYSTHVVCISSFKYSSIPHT
jgi:hypothetical protein